MSKNKSLITGQRISADKIQRARELRKAMTPAEAALWEHLRANRLDNFHFRNQQIFDGFIVDFYCHAAELVVEVDGPVHERQREYDEQRDAVIKRCGLTILRVTNEEIERDIEGVLSKIRACLPPSPKGVSRK